MKKIGKSLWIGILALVGGLCLLLSACGSDAKISFVTDGDPIDSVTVTAGEEFTLPSAGEREGFSFDGWYLDEGYTQPAGAAIVPEEDVTLYAKWTKLYRITTELGGGTLEAPALWLREGANISAFMQDYVPVWADHEFGEWLSGGEPLKANAVMAAADLTLTAHWKTKYTVERYEQTVGDLSQYAPADDYVGYAYAGTAFIIPSFNGFHEVEKTDSVRTGAISENASQNHFKLYYDRESYTVFFRPNYEGAEEADIEETYLYGQEVELPVGLFTRDGYLQTGWSTEMTGPAEYRIDPFPDGLSNSDTPFETDTLTVEDGMLLFAVWSQGCLNMFGGGDRVYHFAEDDPAVYLQRAGKFFVGEFRRDTFTFYVGEGDDREILLQGRFNDNGTFVYSDSVRAGHTSNLFTYGAGIDESVRIMQDAYNGITYFRAQGEGAPTLQAQGTYAIDDETGYYLVTYTSADPQLSGLLGKEWTYLLGYVEGDNVARQSVFMVRDDEELAWGALQQFAVSDGNLVVYNASYNSLRLNGFGEAVVYSSGTASSAYYVREGDTITLLSGTQTRTAIIMQINGIRGYMFYNAATDFTATSVQGATLELDGTYSAVYTSANGRTVLDGIYTAYTSEFGILIEFTANETTRLFLVKTVTDTVVGGEGDSETVTTYTFEERPVTYGEVHYYDETAYGGYYYAPLLVVDETTEGRASLYGYQSATRTYAKVAEGPYVYQEEDDCYLFTVENRFEADVIVSPFDLSLISSFTYRIDIEVAVTSSGSGAMEVMYWTSYTTTDNETHGAETVYADAKGTAATLSLVGGFAFYADGETSVSGAYQISDSQISAHGRVLILRALADGAVTTYRFDLDEEGKKFTYLDGNFGVVYAYYIDGTNSRSETLTFDGLDGAVYSVTAEGETTTYKGTYTRREETTERGLYIFDFEAEGMEFAFVLTSNSSGTYFFSKFEKDYSGTFTGELEGESGTLALDGFGMGASFSINGNVFTGTYTVRDGGLILMTVTGFNGGTLVTRALIYFVLDGSNFLIPGSEFGTYLLLNNQSFDEIYLDFDGFGKVNVFTFDSESEERVPIDEDGSYDVNEDGSITVRYSDGSKEVTLVGAAGVLEIDGSYYNAFRVLYEEVVATYLDESDWSVLILAGDGNAVRYNSDGTGEYGEYVIITDTLLYYADEDGEDACIYEYNTQKGTIRRLSFRQQGYYTETLESLQFSRYGFMIMGGATRYYYNIEPSGNVVIYHQDWSAAEGTGEGQRNKYGFIKEDFGQFDPVKEYGDKTYYLNDGYALTFTRIPENKDKYPITMQRGQQEGDPDIRYPLTDLSFIPTGAAEFSVSGTVIINDRGYQCVVVREQTEEGDYEMYILIALSNGGYLRFDITVTYHGGDSAESTYDVISMRDELTLYSYSYLYLYYYFMVTQNQAIANTFGSIDIVGEYDDAGDSVRTYLTGAFGGDSGMYFTDGTLLYLEEQEFEVGTYGSGVYSVDIEGPDGYQYRFYFGINSQLYQILNALGYVVYGFNRIETLEVEGGYSVTVERFVASDQYNAGGFFSIELKKDGQEIEAEGYLGNGTTVYLFDRTREKAEGDGEDEATGKITADKLYLLSFTETEPEESEEPDEEAGEEGAQAPEVLPTFASVTVTEYALTVQYAANGTDFIETYTEDGKTKVAFFRFGSANFIGTQTTAEDGSYLVTTTSNVIFRITVKDGDITFTQVETAGDTDGEDQTA